MNYDFESSIGYWVTISSLAFRRVLNEQLSPLGITYRQGQVLGWLVLEGPLSQSDLAQRLDVEPSTLAGLIDRMEASGWVQRSSCPGDRRKKLVQLLPGAEPVWEQIAACARLVRVQAADGLTEPEVELLRTLLRKVHQNLTRGEPEHAPDCPPGASSCPPPEILSHADLHCD